MFVCDAVRDSLDEVEEEAEEEEENDKEENDTAEHNPLPEATPNFSPRTVTYTLTSDEVDGDLCDSDSKSLAGYIDITGSKYDKDGEDKHLFYWFFEKRGLKNKTKEEKIDMDIPLILWLTGGPGCSSTLALLSENGPCSVSSDGLTTVPNPNSWTETAHVLWLDQPAGVGFSYGKETDFNEEMVSEDVYWFLQRFVAEYPEYMECRFFIVGESYGGHYAPAVAHKIWEKAKALDPESDEVEFRLFGLAVGNGLTNPIEQYRWYPEMAYNNSHGIKVVSEEVYNGMVAAVPKCQALIKECNRGNSLVNRFACQSAFVLCNTAETVPYQATGLNPYDIRKKCGSNPLCYDFSHIKKWLNLDSTKSALHVRESSHWESCNMGINLKFHTDWMKDFSPYVADLLNDNVPALIYAGDVDFICNYLGNRAWTFNLEWSSGDDFRAAEEREWSISGGDPVGLVRSSGGLTFLQVYDAGHMVPSDQPVVALEMIRKFVEENKNK